MKTLWDIFWTCESTQVFGSTFIQNDTLSTFRWINWKWQFLFFPSVFLRTWNKESFFALLAMQFKTVKMNGIPTYFSKSAILNKVNVEPKKECFRKNVKELLWSLEHFHSCDGLVTYNRWKCSRSEMKRETFVPEISHFDFGHMDLHCIKLLLCAKFLEIQQFMTASI